MLLACRDQAGFAWVRYEDLVLDPRKQLRRICRFLKLSPLGEAALRQPLRDQEGTLWSGNSSFAGGATLTTEPVARYRDLLPKTVLDYIEACCLPELEWLEYPISGSGVFDPAVLERFHEPFPVSHPRFERDYSTQPERIAAEVARYRILSNEQSMLSSAEMRKWFVDEAAYAELRKTVIRGKTRAD
jgi:hypothetical protein